MCYFLNYRLGGTISAYKIVPDEIEEIKVQYSFLQYFVVFLLLNFFFSVETFIFIHAGKLSYAFTAKF